MVWLLQNVARDCQRMTWSVCGQVAELEMEAVVRVQGIRGQLGASLVVHFHLCLTIAASDIGLLRRKVGQAWSSELFTRPLCARNEVPSARP